MGNSKTFPGLKLKTVKIIKMRNTVNPGLLKHVNTAMRYRADPELETMVQACFQDKGIPYFVVNFSPSDKVYSLIYLCPW
jgi:hypothetical protein